jgi:AcrR family transcriptional regulator
LDFHTTAYVDDKTFWMLTSSAQYGSVWSVTPYSWIAAGLRRLASAGLDGISVESLARSLRVTKGSFYWHFEDRADLLNGVLAEWERRDNERFLPGAGIPAADRLARILAFVTSAELSRLEAALLTWARRDPVVAGKLAKAERIRKDFLAQLFEDLGFERQQAEGWASAAYLTLLGVMECCSRPGVSAAARDELAGRFSLVLRAAAALEGSRMRSAP